MALLVKANGTKRWVFIFRFEGKQNRLGFGTYPDASLENARRKAEEARTQIANGRNPADIRNESKQAKESAKRNETRIKAGLPILDSFADVTGKWLDSITNQNSDGTLFKKRRRLTTWIFPVIGDKPINAIISAEVLAALKPLIEVGKLDTAHRLRAEISAILAYAIVHNLADYDPAQPVAKQIPA